MVDMEPTDRYRIEVRSAMIIENFLIPDCVIIRLIEFMYKRGQRTRLHVHEVENFARRIIPGHGVREDRYNNIAHSIAYKLMYHDYRNNLIKPSDGWGWIWTGKNPLPENAGRIVQACKQCSEDEVFVRI
jgi:hypothetical protein